MGQDAARAFFHRQARLRPIQSLNLTLLVGAQHDGVLGWIQIQTGDVFQFLPELRIAAAFEGSHPVWLQPVRPLEDIVLVRDKSANMVWGIESTVTLSTGDPKRGVEISREVMDYFLTIVTAGGTGIAPPPATATGGKNPMWGSTIMRKPIRREPEKLGIHKKIGWHTVRHSYSTLLRFP